MICYNCLIEPICTVGCDKLRNITIDELELNEKILQRLLNSNITLVLIKNEIEVNCDNSIIYWYKNGNFHRDYGPAIISFDGSKYWYKNGKYHREDGPALEYGNGTKEWLKNGKRHREDGPAIEYSDGTKEWYKHGRLHRDDGPAIEYANGNKAWYINGKFIKGTINDL